MKTAAMEAKPGAAGDAARDQRAGLGTARAELMSQRTVYILGSKEMQARYRTEQSNRLSGTLRSKAKHTLSLTLHTLHPHFDLCAHTCTCVCSHSHLCTVTRSHLHTCTHMCPLPYTELLWSANFLSGMQMGPPIMAAASRTIQAIPTGQPSPT